MPKYTAQVLFEVEFAATSLENARKYINNWRPKHPVWQNSIVFYETVKPINIPYLATSVPKKRGKV